MEQPGDYEGYVCNIKVERTYTCYMVCSILAQLLSKQLYGTTSDSVYIQDSGWLATHGAILSRLSQV
jgi:N-dimethylarginine dimethylaminohydrolase